ncbi:hypothetical protein BC940DRAFT_287444 [Gongronella butleri]|nr:hypothetical protein BC940DRAFT_287444 [Gongronella butleri]
MTNDEIEGMISRVTLEDKQWGTFEKKLWSWLYNLPNMTHEEAQGDYNNLAATLDNYKACWSRAALSQDANLIDIQRYEGQVGDIDAIIEKAKADVQGLRHELQGAQKIRDNKLEYDKIALEIMKHKSREEYAESIASLKADIEWLKKDKAEKAQKIDMRKQKLAHLVAAVKNTQQEMEDERKRDFDDRKRLTDLAAQYPDSEDEDDMDGSMQGDDEELKDDDDEPITNNRFKEREDDDDEDGLLENDDATH